MIDRRLKHLFIVGVGRSGTTLLQSMVNAHPMISVMPETHFLSSHLLPHTSDRLEDARPRLVADNRLSRLNLNPDVLLDRFRSNERVFSLAGFYLDLLSEYAATHDVSIVGDKTPKNIEYLLPIKVMAPDAYIVHLIRDPRDVYLSRVQAKWSAGRTDMSHCLAYRAQIQLGQQHGRGLFGNRYIEVFYENFLVDPASGLKRLTDCLGIPYDSAMLDFNESAKELVADDEKEWKRNVTGPLLMNNMNKWRDELSDSQVRRLEAACWPVFAQGLYRRSPKSPRSLGPADLLIRVFFASLSWAYRQRVAQANRKCVRIIRRQLRLQDDG